MQSSDLARANRLYSQIAEIDAALANFDVEGGGRIIQMTIAGGEQDIPISVDVSYMAYPPQMLDIIKQQMRDRQNAILDELASMGITGVEARAATGRR